MEGQVTPPRRNSRVFSDIRGESRHTIGHNITESKIPVPEKAACNPWQCKVLPRNLLFVVSLASSEVAASTKYIEVACEA